MSNKFQKSILERLEQDNLRQKQVEKAERKKAPAPVGPIKEINAPEFAVVEPPAALPLKETVETKPVKPEASLDLSEYLVQGSRRIAKNKTFYLDVEVIEALKKAAQRQNVNDSKLVNDILRKVLKVSG